MNNQINNYPNFHLSLFKECPTFGFYIFDFEKYFLKYPILKNKHAFNSYSIIYIQKGSGTIEIEHDRFLIDKNQLFLISPNQTQFINFESKTSGFIVQFCQDFYLEEYDINRLMKVYIPLLPSYKNRISPEMQLNNDSSSIEKLFSLMYLECNLKNKTISNTLVRSYLNSLLIKVYELNQNRTPKNIDYNSDIIIRFSQLLEENFIQQQDTKFYSDSLKITETTISKIAKLYFNTSIKKVIQNRLMLEARKLLCRTNYTVTEISNQLNFSDNSYFNKVFIKHHKVTPGQFKALHQKHTINKH